MNIEQVAFENLTPSKYLLTVRQHPKRARLCSFKEKVDRRPLDPPPIVQLHQKNSISFNNYWNSSSFFLLATMIDPSNGHDINVVNGHKTTAGTISQSLHKLRDTDNREGAFFVFSDISIRIEGAFSLKFTLFQIDGLQVHRLCAVVSEIFQVYSPKKFPGMSESTEITRLFSEQGVRIRIRKEARARNILPVKRQPDSQEQESKRYSLNSYSSDNDTIPYTTTKRTDIMSMQNLLTSDAHPTSSQRAECSNVLQSSPCIQQNSTLRRKLPLPLPTINYTHAEPNLIQNTTLCSKFSQSLNKYQ
ncbi:velvet factor-domain-containing protein [Sporodiniella umbellata]|nr:velvet factor-domain-containing protein [Sporodiniella umbellata]